MAEGEHGRRGARCHRIEVDHESDHGIEQSIYFREPDGHVVELACYELRGKSEKMPLRGT